MTSIRLVEHPTAPAPGYMNLTLVGTGASTGVPIMGHIRTTCACHDAIARPRGPNCRNNISLLLTLPTTRAATQHMEENNSSSNTNNNNNNVSTNRVPSTANEARGDDNNNDEEEEVGRREREENSSTSNTHNSAVNPTTTATQAAAPPRMPRHDVFISPEQNEMDGRPVRHILIDCGKTFREAYFRVLIRHHVRLIDALLLTHDHADAIAGLDDLRDLQCMEMREGGKWFIDYYIPTYMSAHTLEHLSGGMGYIIRNSQHVGPAMPSAGAHAAQVEHYVAKRKAERAEDKSAEPYNCIGIRRSTALRIFTLPDTQPTRFHIAATAHSSVHGGGSNSNDSESESEEDFPMYTLPVEHGKGYISLGFVFGRGVGFVSAGASAATLRAGSCVVYISDVSAIPAASMAFLRDLVKIDVLYIDCLHHPGKHSAIHFCMDDMVELIVALKPRHAYGVGMFCDIDHEKSCAYLAELLAQYVAKGTLREGEVETISLGYDGMQITLPQ